MKEGRSPRSNASEIAEPSAFSKKGSPPAKLIRIFWAVTGPDEKSITLPLRLLKSCKTVE